MDVGVGARRNVRVRIVHHLLAANLSLDPLASTLVGEGLLFVLFLCLRHFNGLRLLKMRVHYVLIVDTRATAPAC